MDDHPQTKSMQVDESPNKEFLVTTGQRFCCPIYACQCLLEEEKPSECSDTEVVLQSGKTYERDPHCNVESQNIVLQHQQSLATLVAVVNDEQKSSEIKPDATSIRATSKQITENKTKTRRGGRKRGGKKLTNAKKNHLQQLQTTPERPAVNKNICQTARLQPFPSTAVEPDDDVRFQQLADTIEHMIKQLETGVARLKETKDSGKHKQKKVDENALQIKALESKIEELKMQIINAKIGFDRAASCADAEIHRKREIFRLTSPLPALAKRQEFEQAVIENQFVVVMGQTGSGKSTQLTQYLADMPQFSKQMVICTQPRKIAAVTLTQRVAFEFSGGEETVVTKKWVGCHVGGENRLNIENRIRYMTETVLLNQLTQAEVTGNEDLFRKCCAVIVDEAHSRTITTDVLLGVLKRKIHLWPHLKIIVTSATIDTTLFSKYLHNCPVIEIPGRLFPVQVIYRPFDRDTSKIVDSVVKQAIAICDEHQSGDILCFLTGQSEVEWAKQKFTASVKPKASRAKNIVAYCLYGKQTPEEQQKVFQKTPDVQKVIFSTDIAETSITIDGVKFIVDSGLTKNLVFDSARNITSLKEMMISSASAEQRKGRAGRTGPGTCYRIYSEDEYNSLTKYDKAEIFLRPLSITVTLLKAMRVDPLNFEWLEQPDNAALNAAIDELHLLGGLDHLQNLTPLGHLISDLQIDPGIAHMIHYACSKGLGKVATILAGLFSATSMIFWRGGEDETRSASDESKKKYFSDRGDIFTCHLAFTEWLDKKKTDPSMKTVKAWCMENYINNKAMSMVWSTAQEIELHLKRNAFHIWRGGNSQDREATHEELQQLIAQAFVLNVAFQVHKNYVALRADVMTYIHPGSVFFREKQLPQVVTYQNILRTSKTFALQITPIDMEWIRQENGALHALYEEMASRVNTSKVLVTPVSRGILRYILGPANRNVDELNQELDCLVHGEYETDALVAWCKPNAINLVYSELTRRVDNRKRDLEMEMREDPIVGETRIVWGCGGEAKYLLFTGDYISINIRNVPNPWNLTDVQLIVNQKLTVDDRNSVRNLFFLPKSNNQNTKSARIVLDNPLKAATVFQELTKGAGPAGKLEVSPVLINHPSAYKETEAWLTISFAIAPSKLSVIVIYDSLEDANHTIERCTLCFRPSRNKQNETKTSPAVSNNLFVRQQNPFNVKMQYVLYANRLNMSFDETSVENSLINDNCPMPKYIKIVRGNEMEFSNENDFMPTTDPSDAMLLKYAEANELLPMAGKLIKTVVRRDKTRKKVSIRARYESMDHIEMIFVSKLCTTTHYDQVVRLSAQLRTSLRLEKDLWKFRQNEIVKYMVSLKTQNVTYKIETRHPSHVWLHLEVPRMGNIEEVRQQIDTLLQFRLYKSADIELLFTHYGLKKLSALDATPGYLNFNVPTKTIRIYGKQSEREIIAEKLNKLIEDLRRLRIDVPFIIRKASLNMVAKSLGKFQNPELHDELRLFYNRLYATGTVWGIEFLKDDLSDHVIEPKEEINTEDCGVCFSPLENSICLQLCAHKFCSDCIKAMVNQESVPYPIICPTEGCNTKLCLKDIQEIASVSVIDKISQSAVAALKLKSAEKTFRQCFKNGCEQFIPIRERNLEGIDQLCSGGDTVYCDQCNLHYCFTCSTAMKKPIERHRGSTCYQNQLNENKDARWHRLYILDEICVLKCPRCKTAFIDFTGCCALTCSMEHCKAGFCFFCLKDCGRDAHVHVRECSKNPSGGVFIKQFQKNAVHKESRKEAIVNYLMLKCTDRQLRSAVLHSIVKDLKDLEVVIDPSEVDLCGYTPIAETAKHRQHILDEICTLRCPRCRTAFFDFEGCSALTCAVNTCRANFCFFCLKDFENNEQKAMAHVIQCQKNIVPGQLYTPPAKVDEVNQRRIKSAIIQYLTASCPNQTERRAVIESVSFHLEQLNVNISDNDFPPPVPQVTQQAQRPFPVNRAAQPPVPVNRAAQPPVPVNRAAQPPLQGFLARQRFGYLYDQPAQPVQRPVQPQHLLQERQRFGDLYDQPAQPVQRPVQPQHLLQERQRFGDLYDQPAQPVQRPVQPQHLLQERQRFGDLYNQPAQPVQRPVQPQHLLQERQRFGDLYNQPAQPVQRPVQPQHLLQERQRLGDLYNQPAQPVQRPVEAQRLVHPRRDAPDPPVNVRQGRPVNPPPPNRQRKDKCVFL